MSFEWIKCFVALLELDIADGLLSEGIPPERAPPEIRPERNRSLDEISDQELYTFTGLSKPEFRRLHRHWRWGESMQLETLPIPRQIRSEAAMLIYLHHMRSGMDYLSMSTEAFGGDPRLFIYIVRAMVKHLYNVFYNKIAGSSLESFVGRIDLYRRIIWRRFVNDPVQEWEDEDEVEDEFVQTTLESFRIYGFVDDTDQATRTENDNTNAQRLVYSQSFRSHGVKAQVVAFPDGMIGSVSIAALQQNDNGMANMPRLNQNLYQVLSQIFTWRLGLLPVIYGDGIFTFQACIVSRPRSLDCELERTVHKHMSMLRELVEVCYSNHCTLFKVFWQSWRFRLMSDCVVTKEYLPLTEVIPGAPEDELII